MHRMTLGVCVALLAAAVVKAQPVISSIHKDTLPRSGRLAILGSGFGNRSETSRVVVDGITAWFTTWTNSRIVAYVPETANLGLVEVKVIVNGQESNAVPLTVTRRAGDGRVKWTFEADTNNLWFRPALAPDGTIYLHSSMGFVYALSPDGGLKWTQQVNWYPYAPPAAGPDGTLYVGSIWSVFAISPQGQILWQFDDRNAQAVQIVPTPGPDGHLYGVFDPGNPGLGAYSLTTGGQYRWNNIGNPPMFEHGGLGAEMRFGPSQPGGAVDQLYVGMDRRGDNQLYAFSLDGRQRWVIPVGPNGAGAQPVIGRDGTVYTPDFIAQGYGWVIRGFDPSDGSDILFYDGDFISGVSHLSIGPDDTLYYVADLSYLEALDPHTGRLRWSRFTGNVLDAPQVSPDGRVVVCSGVPSYGYPGFIKGFDAVSGAELWEVPLPGDFYPAPRWLGTHYPRFTPDSRTAYVSTVVLAGDDSDPHTFLYALDVAGDGKPGDLDGDGDVDMADLAILLADWGCTGGDCPGDVDGDGDTDQADLAVLLANYGT
jgi:outer membrane protein assembly factor BamB